ncbi:hypothetical protein HPB50_011313 [Hyalomma asiaticum]|uniref:Uncharacterized protein n=1 Tax=Hyalomma asiaticum TaxID=266040 RepID=A0ACB7T9P9_HYAAI|nr:hypothetical protein HPB50_011313 [Hyalomma asiaticum]
MEHRNNPGDLNQGPRPTATGQIPSPGVVGDATTITIPQLWLADPALWFMQAENKARLHRLASEVHKHELLLDALHQAMAEVSDVLVKPPAETPLTTVKQTLLRRLAPL